jgi:hypothetical protein
MARVSLHLKYFIRKKIREDLMWQRLQVIFSGHEVGVGGFGVFVWCCVSAGGSPHRSPAKVNTKSLILFED